MKKLHVGIIGLGRQSLSDHVPALLKRPDIVIVGGCDPDPVARNNFKKAFPQVCGAVPLFATSNELLDSTSLDFAVVAVPHDKYFDIVEELCSRNIPFMKEKPFAMNLEEMERIVSLPNFDKCGFIVSQRRYNKLYHSAKEAIAMIGKPYLFSATYKLNINSPHVGWRGSRASAGGGCLLDMGYHIVDQLIWWFGGVPEKLNAHVSSLAVPEDYDAEDTATVSFAYSNGLHGNLTISRAAGEKSEQYELYGSDGYIVGSKKSLVVKDKRGALLKPLLEYDHEEMTDEQLNFFITRLATKTGFSDIQQEHIKNMQFIERCYGDALRSL